MKRSIRKVSSSVHVTYKDGGYSNNLRGEHFTLENDGNEIVLGIDMSANLRTRNKEVGSYSDVVELSEEYAALSFVELEGDLILEPLQREWEKMAKPKMLLSISLGERGTFRYHVRPEALQIRLRLTVIDVVKA